MSVLKTKQELEKRLAAAFPSTPIAYENVSFTPPEGQAFLRCWVNRGKVTDPVFGSAYRRENATFMVFVEAPYNEGSAVAYTLAEQVKALFYRGLTITVDNLRIQFFDTPQIGGAGTVNNRVVLPVMIDVVTEVYS